MAAAGPGGPPPDGLPPPPPVCLGERQKLPYDITHDFASRFILNGGWFSVVDPPSCDQPFFSDAGVVDAGEPDGGAPAVTGCSQFRYDPDACVAANGAGDPAMAGPFCWAGVIFTPSLAGPMGPGVCVEPGATAIHFQARASRDDARVKFGSIREGLGSTEFFINLTRDWRSYTIMIPAGEDYDASSVFGGVWNGFSVVMEPQDHAGGTTVLVADVIWDR
jgi:hypothetical protein